LPAPCPAPQDKLQELQEMDAVAQAIKLQNENTHLAGLVLAHEATIADLREEVDSLLQRTRAAESHKEILVPVSCGGARRGLPRCCPAA
jgi:hypothetical protein